MMAISQRFSFAGFDWNTYLHNEKDDIKLLLSGFAGISAFFISGISNPVLSGAIGLAVAASFKLLSSALDYWQTK